MSDSDPDNNAAISAASEAVPDRGELVSLMEPMRISETSRHRRELADLAVELAAHSTGFRRSLPEGVLSALGDLVRAMNCRNWGQSKLLRNWGQSKLLCYGYRVSRRRCGHLVDSMCATSTTVIADLEPYEKGVTNPVWCEPSATFLSATRQQRTGPGFRSIQGRNRDQFQAPAKACQNG